jgi:hypothetical protein
MTVIGKCAAYAACRPCRTRRAVSFGRAATIRIAAQLMRLLGGYVDDLFMRAAQEQRKSGWGEKARGNLAHHNFFWELFPTPRSLI